MNPIFKMKNFKILSGHNTLKKEDLIIHFLEFGLGDSINSICIIKGIKKKYPENHHKIYCEKNWIEFIRPFLSLEDEIVGYDHENQTYDEIIKSIEASGNKGYLIPYMIRLPDQWAKGESKQEALVRFLKLNKIVAEVRPEFPVVKDDELLVENFLGSYGLNHSPFIVLAPNVNRKSDKFWKKEFFEELADRIINQLGIKIVVLGKDKETDLSLPGIVKFGNIPLSHAGIIISKAVCYIGLDSGLSHLAGAFNIPLIILYPYLSKDVMPFEVRVHSPFANLYIVNKKHPEIFPESVFSLVNHLKSSNKIYYCPACGRGMWYICQINKIEFIRQCVCGTRRIISFINSKKIYFSKKNEFPNYKDDFLPESTNEIIKFIDSIEKMSCFNINFLDKFKFLNDNRIIYYVKKNEILWSIDGILYFFNYLGFNPKNISKFKKKNIFKIYFHDKNYKRKELNLNIPWEEEIISIPNIKIYFNYLSWESWADRKKMEQISKKIYEFKGPFIAKEISYIIFKYSKSITSLRYFIKFCVLSLFKKLL